MILKIDEDKRLSKMEIKAIIDILSVPDYEIQISPDHDEGTIDFHITGSSE